MGRCFRNKHSESVVSLSGLKQVSVVIEHGRLKLGSTCSREIRLFFK